MGRSVSDDELASLVQHMSIDYGAEEPAKGPVVDVMTNTFETLVGEAFPTSKHDEKNMGEPLSSAMATPKGDEESISPTDTDEDTDLDGKIQALFHEVALLFDVIYEIEELRHSSLPGMDTALTPTFRMDTLIQHLTDSVQLLRPQITALRSNVSSHRGEELGDLSDGVEQLMSQWRRVEEQRRMIKEEMKEDGWLVRFRTTADQAEAMMRPLQKSSIDCSRYLEKLTQSLCPIPLVSEFEDQPSIKNLQRSAKSHQSLTKAYVPSINKILKMMDKSIADRPVQNGEALRRFGEMTQYWTRLQKQLHQLDARIRLIIQQHSQTGHLGSPGDIETLTDMVSPYASPGSRSDYFDDVLSHSPYLGKNGRGPPGSHRSSVSSSVSTSSTRSLVGRQSLTFPSAKPNQATISPENILRSDSLRNRPSIVSNSAAASTRTPSSDQTRWNGLPRSSHGHQQTPASHRTSTTSHLPRSVSPTPSSRSVTSTASKRQSRIPVYSPTNSRGVTTPTRSEFGDQRMIPGLTVSNSHSQTMLTEPSSMSRANGTSQGHLERARMGLKTPEGTRPRMSSSFSAMQPRTSMGTPILGSRTYSSGSTPHTAPTMGRPSLARAPPSSFRLTSPTPSGPRPSSRLSMKSYSNFDTTTLQPFQPSRYDLLDQEVARILAEERFDLFVGRVDPPLKKGQRSRDDEEWKGQYVFGAGDKPTSVKMLKHAGGGGPGARKETKVKCMVRVAGAWHDLGAVLRKRKADTEGN
ncbi:hypothetical protein IAR55_002273 [Kwoniella newhampshirensis]|uniref:GAR domain-containing protein n=1 Tax=Kwoniella newhampshirensis TaxID=1651941 RepID=A0AAW0Z0X3_9TREE